MQVSTANFSYSGLVLFRRDRWITLSWALMNFIHPNAVWSARSLWVRSTSDNSTAQRRHAEQKFIETSWPLITCAMSFEDIFSISSALTICSHTTRTATTFGRWMIVVGLSSLKWHDWMLRTRINQASNGWHQKMRRLSQVGARDLWHSFFFF